MEKTEMTSGGSQMADCDDNLAALRASEEKFRRLAENMSDVVWVANLDMTMTYISPSISRMTGEPAEAHMRRTMADKFPSDALGSLYTAFSEEVEREKDPASDPHRSRLIEVQHYRADGSLMWIAMNISFVRDEKGVPIGLQGVTREITERKQAESERERLQSRLAEAMEIALLGYWEYDVVRDLFIFDDAFYRIFRTTAEQVGGYTMTPKDYADRFLHPDDQWMVAEENSNVVTATDPDYNRKLEHRIRYADGSVGWISVRFFVIRDKAGRVVKTYGVNQDITERKQAEMALKASEEKFRALTEKISDIVWTADLDLQTVYVSPSIRRVLGFTQEERLSQRIEEQLTPESLAYGMKRFARELALEPQAAGGESDRTVTLELEYYHKDGTTRWMETVVGGIRNDRGELTGIHGVSRDITERRQAEARSRQLSDVIDKSLNEIFIFDVHTLRFRHVNQGALKNLQYSLSEIQKMTPVDLKPEFTEAAFRAMIQPLLDNEKESLTIETVHRRADASLYPVEIHLQLIDAGSERVFLAVIFDISERRQAEAERDRLQAQLLQAQKMESVGRLAGGVAHDFNNMLGVILGYTELALEQVGPGQPLAESLQEIRKAAERSAHLTRQLLAYARKQPVRPRVLDLNDTVEGLLQMLRRLIGEDIDLRWLPGTKLWPVRIDPGQIDQILANLCVNARDAIGGVGRVTIRTGIRVFEAADVAGNLEWAAGQYVMLAVSDDGCGMDEKTRATLFEPFFTTKAVGQGTGLGLPTIYGIVKQNNGFIQVESQPGEGATFRIYLPRHVTTLQERQMDQKDSSPMVGGRETVLLVEDEPAILNVGRIMLERLGYRVLATDSPREAPRLAQEAGGRIDLLMTDVVMPEMNGRDLAARLRSDFPELKILFMSGYTADVITHRGILDEGLQFIQKPFSYRNLAAKVRGALGG